MNVPPVAGDHTLTPDEVSPLSLVRRWSCTRCGRLVMGCAGRFWGPAVDEVCRQTVVAYVGTHRHVFTGPCVDDCTWDDLDQLVVENGMADMPAWPRHFRPFRWLP